MGSFSSSKTNVTTAQPVKFDAADNTVVVDSANNKVGIGTASPGTQLQLEGAAPYVTLKNNTAENGDGGCESKIIFEDHANVTLAQIQGSHDGTADDTKGDLILSTHNGTSLTEAVRIDSTQTAVYAGDIEQGGVAAALGGAAFHRLANLQSTSGQGGAGFYQTVAPTNAVPQVLIYNNAVVSDGSPLLRVENANADENGAILNIHKSSASPADDDTLGFVTFSGRNASAATKTYAEMKVRSTDVTANDEGGEISFSVFAGGSGGTAALSSLLKIGGEDVANSGPLQVAVNDAALPCDFRVGSAFHRITVDQDIRFAHSGDNTVIVQIPNVKIPANAIITRVVAVPTIASNLTTHAVNIQFSATSGTAADSSISSGTEILGAGGSGEAEDFTSSDADETKEDIDLKNDVKEVYMNESLIKVGGSDVYLYVCNAGTGNGTTNSTAGTLSIIVEYFGVD